MAAAKGKAATRERYENPSTYFRRTHPFVMAVILIIFAYHAWAIFSPATIPYDYLGPLGTFTKYLVENHKPILEIGYVITWLGHAMEALYALKLCKNKGITDYSTQFRWIFQTLFFGYLSLYHLVVYKPPKEEN